MLSDNLRSGPKHIFSEHITESVTMTPADKNDVLMVPLVGHIQFSSTANTFQVQSGDGHGKIIICWLNCIAKRVIRHNQQARAVICRT